MKTITRMVVGITKQNLASLFASAFLAAASVATPMTVYAQSNPLATGQDLNLQASNSPVSMARGESELVKLDALPPAGRAYISRTLGANIPAYHVAGEGADLHAAARGLKSDFTAQGVELSADSSHLRLALDAYGHSDNLTKVSSVPATRVAANRVEYRRAGITEWYDNGPLGLEQGFTVEHPEKNSSGLLTIALGMEGNMTAKVKDDGKSVILSSAGGKNQFDYAGLIATDADGKELPSHLEVAGGKLLIKVDDGRARYPVTIDPYVYQSTLPAIFSTPYTDGGDSVAVDGKPSDFVVAVGAPLAVQPTSIGGNGSSSGVVYVFESTNCCSISTTWTMSVLYPSDGANGDHFGGSLSIENNAYLPSEGQTIAVGAPLHSVNSNAAAGKAYVYVRPTGGWVNSAETGSLVNGSGLAGVEFGFSVSVQNNEVAIGEPQPYNCVTNCLAGAAYVYVEPTLTWTACTPCITPSATLTVPALANGSEFGFSVSISNQPAQKGIVIVGAPQLPGFGGCNCGPGHAYVYVQPGGGWAGVVPIHRTLNNPYSPRKDWFGFSVASSMGYLAVIGAPNATCTTGCASGYPVQTGLAYEYESNNNWITPGTLFPSNGATGDLFGVSVSTDGKGGDLVAVGAPDHNGRSQGAGYLFTSRHWGTGGQYPENQSVANGTGGQFGWSAAAYVHMGGLNKSAAVFGAPVTNSYAGAAYLYWHP